MSYFHVGSPQLVRDVICGIESVVLLISPDTLLWRRNGEELPQRFLIGRTFHDGELYSNASDTLGVQTLSVDPRPLPYGSSKNYSPRHFIGLGVCCDTDVNSGCDRACHGHAGELVLVAFSGDKRGTAPYFLAMVDEGEGAMQSSITTDQDNVASLQLGVLLKMPGWSPGPTIQAHVLGRKAANGTRTIHNFVLTSNDETGVVAVKDRSTSVSLQPLEGVDAPWIWQSLRD